MKSSGRAAEGSKLSSSSGQRVDEVDPGVDRSTRLKLNELECVSDRESVGQKSTTRGGGSIARSPDGETRKERSTDHSHRKLEKGGPKVKVAGAKLLRAGSRIEVSLCSSILFVHPIRIRSSYFPPLIHRFSAPFPLVRRVTTISTNSTRGFVRRIADK